MHRSKLIKGLQLGVLATALAAVPTVFAQVVTTSSLTGSVVSQKGEKLAKAELTITHQPTGTTYKVSSREDGSFQLNGLRPGGPYTIVVTSEGGRPVEMNEVYLEIDRGADIKVEVPASDVTMLERFVVTSDAMDQVFNTDQAGSVTHVSAKQIDDMPAGDRSINALARIDPRITYNRDPQDRAISVSGLSNRYNLIQVDGVNASDPFGLNANNTAAERNVIPVDALESLAINTAPYNARNAGFVGAQINAVTKSGTNEFKGSAYYNYRAANGEIFGQDYRFVGEWMDDKNYPLTNYTERTFGATLGGPLIKNKLWFYISWEKVNEDRVAPKPTAAIADATLQQIIAKAKELGFAPGEATPPSGNKLKDDNVIVKLDWQINSQHRASLRYNEVSSSRPTFPNFGSGSSQNNFSFDSAWYDQVISNKALIGQLISTWSDDLSTELSISRSKYHSEPKNATRQPYVEIRRVPVPNTTNTSYITFGTENSRHFNILDTETDTAELLGTYRLGNKHTLQSGVQVERSDVFNAFVQNTLGYYRYNSLEDFLNKAATGGAYGGDNSYTLHKFNDGVDPAATFTESNVGLFINDRWKPFSSLAIDMGVRADMAVLPDEVPYNGLFEQTFKERNDNTYNGKKIAQPRVGFTWTPDTKLRTTVRGGAGLFYGRAPRVWISNSFSNTGLNYTAYTAGNSASNAMPAISANPDAQPTTGSTSATQQVAYMANDFSLPSRWKGNLAIDRELGFWDLKATAEYEVTYVRDDVFYTNVNLDQSGTGPDGRALYWDKANAVTINATTGAVSQSSQGTRLVSSKFTNRIIRLGNTDEGSTKSLMFSLERPRKSDGWYWRASWVKTDADEVLFGTSSVAASNWNNRSVFNTNEQELSTATLEVKDKITLNITKDLEAFKGYKTTIGMFYEGRSGYPYSFAFTGDANGDSQTGNDLLYVPVRGDTSKVKFATAADEANFYAIVDRFGLQQGAAVKANDHRYPWVNQFDVSLKQEVKLPGWKHRLVLGVDILNIGNLLNSKWGVIRGSNQYFVRRESVATVNYDGVNKQYVYSKVSTDLATNSYNPALGRGEPAATRWTMLFTAKYEF